MIYVQHLLGIGHLRRAGFLACALADKNIQVDFVSGGMPVAGLSLPGVTVHQLPPVRSLDGKFDKLVDAENHRIDDAWKARRRDQLLALFDDLSPHALITETFPFGRRMMRFELLPLLVAARECQGSPLVVASIRDILQPKSKPGRDREIHQLLDTYYDRVLIHGDQRVATLGETFPLANEVADKLFYTGYIVDPGVDSEAVPTHLKRVPENAEVLAGDSEIIISGGGGAASLPLLRAAVAAKPLSSLQRKTWRLLVGHNIDKDAFEQLQRSAVKGLIIERNRTDFPTLLQRCAVSVSQAGYNTVMDILKSGTRAVLVPFAQAGELEQTLRATLLQQRNRVVALEEKDLTPQALAQAVKAAITIPLQSVDFALDGANVSARLLCEWLNLNSAVES